jgi:hypothetical protein
MSPQNKGTGNGGSSEFHDTRAPSPAPKVVEPIAGLERAFRRFLKKLPEGISEGILVSIQKTSSTERRIELTFTETQWENLWSSSTPRILLQRGDGDELKVYKVNPPASQNSKSDRHLQTTNKSKNADSTNGRANHEKDRKKKKRSRGLRSKRLPASTSD